MKLPIETYRNRQTLLIQALESGEYKQGKFTLYNPALDTYCALGVAREVFRKNCRELTSYEKLYTGCLPSEVYEWFGWKTTNGMFIEAFQLVPPRSLTAMNDAVNQRSFQKIAQFLRKHPDAIKLNPELINP